MAQFKLRSWGIIVPSVSSPIIIKPFSALITCNASVPYGMTSNSDPASNNVFQKSSPDDERTDISKDNSPEKEILKIRALNPPNFASTHSIKPRESFEISVPPNFSSNILALGPTTAICAYCSVTFCVNTFQSHHSVCNHSSMCA